MAPSPTPAATLPRDLLAGLVVFLVALPLCLGIALASGAPLFSGLVAGIVGGILVGVLSGSHTSVAGPAAGLTAVVAAQIALLGSFQAFLLAVVLAGVIQIVLGVCRAGFLSAFFPSSVVKGLLAAIGVILILKQIPHVLGHDTDPEGEMSFQQPDNKNTFTELANMADVTPGAAVVGVLSVLFLVLWDRSKKLKKSVIPAPLLVVLLGVALAALFKQFGGGWSIGTSHLVQVPVATSVQGFFDLLARPDFSKIFTPAIYLAAFTIAAVASLETLINLEAVDKLDPQKRVSPASRELVAQGVGNVACGLVGGLPITSVIVRSSVNINAGAQTKVSAVFHGLLLLLCVALLPLWLNKIPLACLAAILLVTGLKLASPKLVKQMWKEGRSQFLPFIITVVAIVLTDLLVGVLIGLGVSTLFILHSNVRRPLRVIVEKHLGGEVIHIELATQVSFLNRAALDAALNEIPRGGRVLLDARRTDYIDADILDLIREFKDEVAAARGVEVSLVGFREQYKFGDRTQFIDYTTRERDGEVTPAQVLQILKDGHERFRVGSPLTPYLGRNAVGASGRTSPLAAVISCSDSGPPTEVIFDVGVGDILSVQVAGAVADEQTLGGAEFACAAGAKVVLVLGHTRCAVAAAAVNAENPAAGCRHMEDVVRGIRESMNGAGERTEAFVNDVSRQAVRRSVKQLLVESETLAGLVRDGRVAVIGAMYDGATRGLQLLAEDATTDTRSGG